MAKPKLKKKPNKSRQKASKRKPHRKNDPSQTQQPFEQDTKRRIGQFGGTGEPPLMKK